MVNCAECGKHAGDGKAFCDGCGKKMCDACAKKAYYDGFTFYPDEKDWGSAILCKKCEAKPNLTKCRKCGRVFGKYRTRSLNVGTPREFWLACTKCSAWICLSCIADDTSACPACTNPDWLPDKIMEANISQNGPVEWTVQDVVDYKKRPTLSSLLKVIADLCEEHKYSHDNAVKLNDVIGKITAISRAGSASEIGELFVSDTSTIFGVPIYRGFDRNGNRLIYDVLSVPVVLDSIQKVLKNLLTESLPMIKKGKVDRHAKPISNIVIRPEHELADIYGRFLTFLPEKMWYVALRIRAEKLVNPGVDISRDVDIRIDVDEKAYDELREKVPGLASHKKFPSAGIFKELKEIFIDG
nr:hypothetical protein [Candidatus Sigynarchaeum springense]